MSWAMQPERMAQIRRDPASEVVSVSRAEIFAPPGPGHHSPIRPFAAGLRSSQRVA
jgi:hypothetical protein